MYRHESEQNRGFTLVELLVVISIIALLIAILLPSLRKARDQAKAVVCQTNLHAVGQGMHSYATDYDAYPASYIYKGQRFVDGMQVPDKPMDGYIHWSWFIYNEEGGAPVKSFQCPALHNKGLPPTNPEEGNFEKGQSADTPGVVDLQAPRMAYTANEALVPRNKWTKNFQNAKRTYHYVAPNKVRKSSGTILATEFFNDWRVVSGAGRIGGGETTVAKSHRPVHAFDGWVTLDMDQALPNRPIGRVTKNRIKTKPPEPYADMDNRLEWVGRNHVGKTKTNFLYTDGHVELKKIEDTVPGLDCREPGEWGEYFYSLEGGANVAPWWQE